MKSTRRLRPMFATATLTTILMTASATWAQQNPPAIPPPAGAASPKLIATSTPIRLQARGPVPASASFRAKIVEIVDGDTLVVEQNEKRIMIHLFGVDAPALPSDAGKAAQAFLQERALNRIAQVETWNKNAQNENEARVTLSFVSTQRAVGNPKTIYDPTGLSNDLPRGATGVAAPEADRVLNVAVVKAGLARFDRKQTSTAGVMRDVLNAEAEAKKAKLGLWAEPKTL